MADILCHCRVLGVMDQGVRCWHGACMVLGVPSPSPPSPFSFSFGDYEVSMTNKEESALFDLLAFLDDGIEFPDAEWKASVHHGIDTERLRELYDAECGNQ